MIEICCGGYEDAIQATEGGADRIELNSALFMGGLTPSLGTLQMAKEKCGITTIAMVRPRGGGFCYSEAEYQTMLLDAKLLLEHGSDGIAFGFLKEDSTIDMVRTKKMTELILTYGKEPVFHRAFDVAQSMETAVEQIIQSGCKRILTSGGMETAMLGIHNLEWLQRQYGKEIEFVAGSGVNEENAAALVKQTGITQLHSSCREWRKDPTTVSDTVSYAFYEKEPWMYDCVSREKVSRLVSAGLRL